MPESVDVAMPKAFVVENCSDCPFVQTAQEKGKWYLVCGRKSLFVREVYLSDVNCPVPVWCDLASLQALAKKYGV